MTVMMMMCLLLRISKMTIVMMIVTMLMMRLLLRISKMTIVMMI